LALAFSTGTSQASPSSHPEEMQGERVPGDAPAVPQPASRADFSGHWVLNAKASDDPQERVKRAMKQARSGGQGMRGGMGGMGRGGRGGGRHGGGSPEGMAGRSAMPSDDMAALTTAARSLVVTHEDPVLLIVDENEQRQRLYTDFRGASISVSGGPEQRVAVAGWEGGELVVESRMRHGSMLVQQYRIDPATDQLIVAASVQFPEGPVAFRLVYDRLSPGTRDPAVTSP
jgi:hypothetical protein